MSWDQLRQQIETSLNVEDVRTLCFDLGEDYESLPGEGKSAKVRELIALFRRRGRVTKLIDYLARIRPNVPWNNLRLDESSVSSPSAQIVPPPQKLSPASDTDIPAQSSTVQQQRREGWRNWGDHPIVVGVGLIVGIVGLLAAVIAIYIFVTGRTSLEGLNSGVAAGNCPPKIGQQVHMLPNVNAWSEPTVSKGGITRTFPTRTLVTIIGGKQWGIITYNTDIAGYWWEVADSSNGQRIGWVWEGQMEECKAR